MKTPLGIFASAITALSVLVFSPSSSESAPSPKQLIDKAVDNQIFNLAGAELKMAMLLRNKRGDKRERKMQTLTRRKDNLNRTVTRFVYPPDVARTAFLFTENRGRDDDQYMFLPAINVIRRIVGSQKDASFMGSDFTYADLESRDHDRATHKKLPDAKLGTSACHVIESKPKNKTYSKLVSWIRKKDNVFLRIQYFDKKGRLLKVFFSKEIKKVGNQRVLTRFKLSNKQTGHSTVIAITDIKLRSDLGDDLFTKRALKKR